VHHIAIIFEEARTKTGGMAYKMRTQTGNTQTKFITDGKMGPEAQATLESHMQADKMKRSMRNYVSTIAPLDYSGCIVGVQTDETILPHLYHLDVNPPEAVFPPELPT
jgi:hypothetical protein